MVDVKINEQFEKYLVVDDNDAIKFDGLTSVALIKIQFFLPKQLKLFWRRMKAKSFEKF